MFTPYWAARLQPSVYDEVFAAGVPGDYDNQKMEKKMPWKKKVGRSFGCADGVFAGHPIDQKEAKSAIKDAKANGASFDDFANEMTSYLGGAHPNATSDHVSKQIDRARKMW